MSFGILAITGLIGSYIAWRIEWISRALWFRYGGLAVCAALIACMGRDVQKSSAEELLPTMLVAIAASICWAPFLASFFTYAVAGLARNAVSLDQIEVSPGYSQAEAAAAQKDYDKALLLYHQVAAEYPQEAEPHRRMGELFLVLNQPDDAIIAFRDAQARLQEPRDQLPAVFRISEILAEQKKDVSGAAQAITDFLSQHPEVEGRAFAEERLRKLRARMAEDGPGEP